MGDTMNIVKKVERAVRKAMPKSNKASLSHDFNHVKRVQKYALQIARDEGISKSDMEIISIAALMHDLQWSKGVKKTGRVLPAGVHGRESARIAARILKKLKYPQDKIEKVKRAIEAHEWSQVEHRGLPSQIIWEADKLDGGGAIGVWRLGVVSSDLGIDIKKIIKIMDEIIVRKKANFKTKTGRKLLKPRLKYMEKFLKDLKSEIKKMS